MKKGFTLIELLVVIAILAVLATAVVLVLNPAELIKQGRDSTRISDMAALNSAISLWVSDVLNPSGHWPASNTYNCTAGTTKPGGATGCTLNANTTTTGTNSWVKLDFSLIAAGSPLSRLPLDPNNSGTCQGATSTTCQYAFAASSTVGVYELDVQMESNKFYSSGSGDVTSKDGGNMSDIYEVGSNLSLF
jgi:prepilin-type N-terminal cleavage/methylation domain-containing protein